MPSNKPLIRPSNPEDYESVAQLIYRSHTISFKPFATEEWVTSRDIDEYRERWREDLAASASASNESMFVAVIDDAIVGTVKVGPTDSPDFDAHLVGMHVDPELRGGGIGSLLMARAKAFIKEQGFERVELAVISSNALTRNFYENHGWVEHASIPVGGEGVPLKIYRLA
jgi:ribosomal protein S18 acetylase RimI-like enzyme